MSNSLSPLSSSNRNGFRFRRLIAICLVHLAALTFVQAQQVFLYDANGNLQGPTTPSTGLAPGIVSPPQYALAQLGGTASFSVVANGTAPLTYQWRRNNTNLPGATSDTLSLSNLLAGDFAPYVVVLSNTFGAITSTPAVLYLDSNRNDLPDSWELSYFGSLTNSIYADPDHDGISNLQEFLDGTNPTNNASALYTLAVNQGVEVQPVLDRFPSGTTVTLTALPAGGQVFIGWSNALTGARNPASLVISSNTTVTALRGSRGLSPDWAPTFTSDDGAVYYLLVQPDDRVVVAGRFSDINGRPAQNLARLNADGTVDTNFLAAIGLGPTDNSFVYSLARQPDGKLLLVGNFRAVNSFPRNGVARLNPDGSVDPTFDPGAGPDSTVFGVGVLSDGRIVVGGTFRQFSGLNRNRVAMLSSTGAVDTTFAPTNGFNSDVYDVSVQSGDRVLLSGAFTTYENQPAPHLARIGTNAVLDATFNPGGTGPNANVQRTAPLRDGRLVSVGQFDHYNTTPGRAVILDANGLPQNTLTNTVLLNTTVNCFVQDAANGFILGGNFSSLGATPVRGLARFNADGTPDTLFSSGTANAANRQLWGLAVQSNGRLFAGGEFSTWNGAFQDRLIALNSTNAAPITNLQLHAAFRAQVTQLLPQPDGSMMVGGGNFRAASGKAATFLARLTPQGAPDPNFAPTNPPNGSVYVIYREPDGSYLVGGGFGVPANNLARYLADGSSDPAFQIGSGFDGSVYALLVQPDGGIVVGGTFGNVQGPERQALVRLLPGGARDDTFQTSVAGLNGNLSGGAVYALAAQPDGKLLIGGSFGAVLGVPLQYVARLWPDGQLDTSFDPGSGADNYVDTIAVQPDGKILIAGAFNFIDGLHRRHIARLMPDGSPDLSFGYDNSGVNGTVFQMSLQPDGSIYVVGDFGEANGAVVARCAHFWADGTLDTTFNPGIDFNDNVYALATGADGSVSVGGWIRQVYGQPRAGAARLVTSPGFYVQITGTQPSGPSFAPNQVVQLSATASSPSAAVTGLRFEISTDGNTFTPIGDGVPGQNSQWVGSWQPFTPGTYYVRAVASDASAQQQASVAFGPIVVTGGQGGYASWVSANFSLADQSNPAVSGMFADPDHDGAVNLLEYAMGTSPTNASSVPRVTGGFWPVPGSPQYFTLSYRQNLAATDVSFVVQVSSNLVTWLEGPAYTTLVDVVNNGDGTQTVRQRSNVPVGSVSPQFLRLKITSP
jgi:uncharacterized delta-60 repeat protein